jgi:hypothetical protein
LKAPATGCGAQEVRMIDAGQGGQRGLLCGRRPAVAPPLAVPT